MVPDGRLGDPHLPGRGVLAVATSFHRTGTPYSILLDPSVAGDIGDLQRQKAPGDLRPVASPPLASS